MQAFRNSRELRSYLPEDTTFPGWKAILGEGDDNPELVVIAKAPTGWEAGKNKPLMGDAGVTIRRAFVKRGIPFYATHAFPFYRRNEKPKKRHAEATAPIVREELARVDADRYLLLGSSAARWTPTFDQPFSKFKEVVHQNIRANGAIWRVTHAHTQIARIPGLFREFLDGLDSLMAADSTADHSVMESGRYYGVRNRAQARKILEGRGQRLALDLETTGLDPYTDQIVTIQISDQEGIGWTFPWDLFTPDEWQGFLSGKKIITQNGSFDIKFLATHGVYLQLAEDTMLMHSLVNEQPGTHSMERMARKELGIEKWTELVNWDEGIDTIPWRDLATYGARDADITLRLANRFKKKCVGRHVNTVLHNAQNALIRRELVGIRVDRDSALDMREEIEGIKHDLQVRLSEEYGLENANSPKQVGELLYDTIGIPEQKKRGKRTTASSYIEPFANEHPVVRSILEYRHLTKADSTYLKRILNYSERDGRYHPKFRLAATETGRVAEQLITLIPRPDHVEGADRGKQFQYRLRELFIPDPGYVMIGADYSGLEVRMAAHLSHDRQLVEDVSAGLDTHSAVAIDAFDLDIPLEPLETLKGRTKAEADYERTLAKFATFTWLYGGGAGAIARQLDIELDDADKILTSLRTRYPDLAIWQERLQLDAQRKNTITTPWGRTRHFMFGRGMSRKAEQDQLRESINFPIQAMASDMTLAAFAQLEQEGIEVLFPFHDAIYAQAPERDAKRVKHRVKTVMEGILDGPVLFEVEAKIGETWAQLG